MSKPSQDLKVVSAHNFVFCDGSVWNLMPANHSIMDHREEKWVRIYPK